ncbi:D-2-hydroxyacid dehydrogenase family protein [Conexibacter sp. DBS9H8]|uniref:D-2-hydroxyacid dehydrogenase family protein n=1 Tax=Conexibacter sp. DBS9H8 TaxID=2937801 RepID=UPI00200F2093|nr:D-2-hydroxyacid dehydrogenase family protein [Conexibacter sp. DBS9H8]
MRIAVLDDYQGLARAMADWDRLAATVDFFGDPIPAESLAATLAPYEVIVLMRERTALSADTLAQLPRLTLVVSTGMRNASLDVAHLQRRGIPVSGTGVAGPGRTGPGGPGAGPGEGPGSEAGGGVSSTVELAWALILALTKHVTSEDRALRAGHWQTALAGGLGGRTLGLLGLGRLGAEMVAPARAFGMEVIAWSAHLDPARAHRLGATPVSADELYSRADVLSIHLVLSQRTRHLIGAPELARMRPSAVLINTSRAGIVDTDALVAALEAGEIAGAGLDVYDQEPLGADDPILTAPNTVLTPHLGYATEATLREMYEQVVEDIAAYLSGAPIRLIEA